MNGDNKRMPIGHYAERTRLSLKALRLYQQKGLLSPVEINEENGYRYYSEDQVRVGKYIRLLREIDMPLAIIKEFVEVQATDPRGAEGILNYYLRLTEQQFRRHRAKAVQVGKLLTLEEGYMTEEREICLDELEPVEHRKLKAVLAEVLEKTEFFLKPESYRLVGTAAAVLQGVDLPARGVNLLMRERDTIDALHLALSEYQVDVPPTYLPESSQYWASYFVEGVHVDASTVEIESESDTSETFGRGPWEHFTSVPCGRHTVPAVALELRIHTDLHRERPEKYGPTIRFVEEHGCDHDLMERCISGDCSLSAEIKNQVHRVLDTAPDTHAKPR